MDKKCSRPWNTFWMHPWRLEPRNQPFEKGKSFELNLHDLCSKLGESLVVPYTVSPSPFKFGWVVSCKCNSLKVKSLKFRLVPGCNSQRILQKDKVKCSVDSVKSLAEKALSFLEKIRANVSWTNTSGKFDVVCTAPKIKSNLIFNPWKMSNIYKLPILGLHVSFWWCNHNRNTLFFFSANSAFYRKMRLLFLVSHSIL